MGFDLMMDFIISRKAFWEDFPPEGGEERLEEAQLGLSHSFPHPCTNNSAKNIQEKEGLPPPVRLNLRPEFRIRIPGPYHGLPVPYGSGSCSFLQWLSRRAFFLGLWYF
jgi:hypothetical protein